MKGRRALWLTLGITAALVVLLGGLRGPYARFLAYHWQNHLDTVPDDRVAVLLKSVAQLGEPGIPVLVEALGSEREAVARCAKRVLAEEMGHWESLRARQYSPKLAILAKALADRAERFGPDARADAAVLASQILRLWTLDANVVDPTDVIACCERVLRATRAEEQLLAEKGSAERLSSDVLPGEFPGERRADLRPGLRRPIDLEQEAGPPLRGLAALPGGGLPIETLDAHRAPADHADAPRVADADVAEPRRLTGHQSTGPLSQPLRPLSEPDHPAATPERAAVPPDEHEPSDRSGVRPLGFVQARQGTSGGQTVERSAPALLSGVDTVELMRRLQSPDDRTAAAARAELARRGFTATHLALARQMFHPDAKVRMQLASVLLDTRDVDAVPWLMQLSRDEHPDVRLAAIALMATTGDPALLAAIETLAREDRDPRVQRQAERIAQKRRTSSY